MRIVELADKREHVVGSDPAADIRLADSAVASRHAILKCASDNHTTIAPASQDCPVLVNLRFIEGAVHLADGDLVSIGSTTLTFHDVPRTVWVDVLDKVTFHQKLNRRTAVCRAAGNEMNVLVLELADGRAGKQAGLLFDALAREVQEDDLLGWDGGNLLYVASWFHEDPGQFIDRLACVVHQITPVQARGAARYPDDGADADGLVHAARKRMSRPDPGQAGLLRPLVRTTQLGGAPVHFLDPGMRQILDTVASLADTDLPVLIQGETGSGKEVIARAVHEWSARQAKPLVTVNCAAIVDTLVENELFGHEPGAFTGAGQAKAGLLEAAEGGTVFLDEIGECSPQIQAKLLRVLETRRVSRLGSVKERRIDVRWVAATNRNLKREVGEGRFRSDLLFRLNTVSITVPPLRERRVEIPLLARTFLENACTRVGREVPAFSLAAVRRLVEYPWPGNVRELRSLMEYLAATTDGHEILEHQLPSELQGASRAGVTSDRPGPALDPPVAFGPNSAGWDGYPGLYQEIRLLESSRIREALDVTGGVRIEAARLLGIPLRTFHTKIKDYGIANRTEDS